MGRRSCHTQMYQPNAHFVVRVDASFATHEDVAYLVAEAAHARAIWLLLNLESVERKRLSAGSHERSHDLTGRRTYV